MRIIPSSALGALGLLLCCSLAACSSASPPATSTSSTEQLQESASDGGDAADSGALAFPAWKPPAPQLTLHGGAVLAAPKFQLVRFASDPGAAPMKSLLQKMGSSSYWKETTGEYGVTGATALPEIALPDSPPAKIDDTEIAAWLVSQLDEKNTAGLSPVDANTVYVWAAPATTVITKGHERSCLDFDAYHRSATRSNGMHVPYIVMPRCSTPKSTSQDGLTVALSHEMIEAATDPVNGAGFDLGTTDQGFSLVNSGTEAGDLCALSANSIRPADLGAAVQRSWSNRAAAAGHDPCVPAQGTVNFGAFTDAPDHNGSHPAIKLTGGERTVKVKLFSDAPMGDFTVSARDFAASQGDAPELDVEFADGSKMAKGKNGDVFELTITARGRPSFDGASVVVLESVSSDRKSEHLWGALVVH